MNVITKLMYSIHRILGTLLCILFLMWFLSAFVMMYHRFSPCQRQRENAKAGNALPNRRFISGHLLRHGPSASWRKGQVHDAKPQCRTPRVQL